TLFVLSLAASLLSSSGLSSLHPDIITLPLTPDIFTLVQHRLIQVLTAVAGTCINLAHILVMRMHFYPFLKILRSEFRNLRNELEDKLVSKDMYRKISKIYLR